MNLLAAALTNLYIIVRENYKLIESLAIICSPLIVFVVMGIVFARQYKIKSQTK